MRRVRPSQTQLVNLPALLIAVAAGVGRLGLPQENNKIRLISMIGNRHGGILRYSIGMHPRACAASRLPIYVWYPGTAHVCYLVYFDQASNILLRFFQKPVLEAYLGRGCIMVIHPTRLTCRSPMPARTRIPPAPGPHQLWSVTIVETCDDKIHRFACSVAGSIHTPRNNPVLWDYFYHEL